ncbi:MAG TPA: VWA domain-containing protein [Blastocatellia bacterium]|nr:VWA domain-containing protein [Blastocatellia bacterium]
MIKHLSLAMVCLLALNVSAFAVQQTQPATDKNAADKQSAPQKDKDEVVRISVTLVQVDAVVTDDKGRHVTDLKPEDFEIYEDGRRQQITNFNYVTTGSATPAPAEKSSKPPLAVPPSNLRPDQVRRTIALVVDDLGLSFESTAILRDSLKKFIDQQMQQGDLVAVIRTGAGMGALQQFTADKRQLYAAIERVRWNPLGRGGISAFAPIERDPARLSTENGIDAPRASESVAQLREDLFAVGTLGALNFIVRGLRDLPGRKSVILFSDGFKLFNRNNNDILRGTTSDTSRVVDALHRLTDLANRASVVVYTVDVRGLQPLGFTAADTSLGAAEMTQKADERRNEFFDTQEGLNYLAQQTGGFFVRNTNDINRGISRVLEDQKGYYLIGYVPDSSTFRAERGKRQFHKFSMKVKRAGLRVRTRTGFYGIADEEVRPAVRTPAQQIIAALTSPFSSGGIRVKLTSMYGHDAKAGSFMRSMLYINGNDLTFTDAEGGFHKGEVNIAAFTFSDNGRIVDQESRTYTFHVPDDSLQNIRREGFRYTLIVPIKKPGAYQLRVAVRDATSERLGSANQFIEVPDISKNRLTLSGIGMLGIDPAKVNKTEVESAISQADGGAEGAKDDDDALASPAVRKFRPGMVFDYGFGIYNARLDSATARPQLESQVVLLRDGKPIYTGKPSPVDVGQQTDLKHIVVGGRMQLGTDMEPGEYMFQVIVIDKLAKEKYNAATQWLDFEIVK